MERAVFTDKTCWQLEGYDYFNASSGHTDSEMAGKLATLNRKGKSPQNCSRIFSPKAELFSSIQAFKETDSSSPSTEGALGCVPILRDHTVGQV